MFKTKFLLFQIILLIVWLYNYSGANEEKENCICGAKLEEAEFVTLPPYFEKLVSEKVFTTPPPPGPPLQEPDTTWVENTLASMNLDQKIGQMIIAWFSNTTDAYQKITAYHVGGFIFSRFSAQQIFDAVTFMQSVSSTPLWFAADFEAGAGTRVYDATTFPMNMALGAADDTTLAEQCGRITAREARAMGIQIGFGPVVDVNTEPQNPIISTRSYSDDPDRVTALAHSFVNGAHEEGLLCTLKHYPGHGPTTGDSHNELPVVNLSLEELTATHIKPYSNLLQNTSIDLIMTAHVWYTALDPGTTAWPATLSTTAIHNILRTNLGYNNIVITDAFNMAGLQNAAPTQQAVVYAVKAGVDIILMPPNLQDVFTGLKNAISNGEITEERINQSVRRILIAKSKVGLPTNAYPIQTTLNATLAHPDHKAIARRIAEKSVTLVSDRVGALPVGNTERILCLYFVPTKTGLYSKPPSYFINVLSSKLPYLSVRTVSRTVTSSERTQIVNDARNYDKVIIANYDWIKVESTAQQALVTALSEIETPLIYVSFGSPYHLLQFPQIDAFLCGYCSQEDVQSVCAEVIVGERIAEGKLPVNIYWTCVPDWAVYK